MIGRRGLVAGVSAVGCAGVLGGCGFHPLYLPASGGGAVDASLASVYVPVMSERAGQLMRQALQQRLDGPGLGVRKRYELITAPMVTSEGISLQTDSSVTRIRFNGTANWSLRRLDPAHTVVTSGSSRITDGLNVVAGQFFAVDIESETVTKRVVESLADQIVAQVAVFLRKQPPPAG